MSRKSVNTLVIAALATIALPAAPSLADDQSFLVEAMKGDNSEVTLGRIAEKKGSSEGIRSFGKELVADHAKGKKQALRVAQNMKVPETDALSDEAIKEKAKLSGLSGSAFDNEFASYMVKDHEEDIEKFNKEASEGSGQTAELAKQTLPDLHKHLKTAQSLQK